MASANTQLVKRFLFYRRKSYTEEQIAFEFTGWEFVRIIRYLLRTRTYKRRPVKYKKRTRTHTRKGKK